VSNFKLRQAKHLIQNGGVIACPTEAVYGLSCDPLNPLAVEHLLKIKKRPAEKGLILVASSIEQLLPFIKLDDSLPLNEIRDSWPGPATWLLPAADKLPRWINGGKKTVACRVTAHPLLAALCKTTGHALISTSANQSGRPPALNALDAHLRCPGIDAVLCGKLGEQKKPTTIRDARTGATIR